MDELDFKGTKGNWFTERIEHKATLSGQPETHIKAGEVGVPVALLPDPQGVSNERQLANAKLMAASPDLLFATQKFTEGWDHFLDAISFSTSSLDADAIKFMNEVPTLIQTAINKALK